MNGLGYESAHLSATNAEFENTIHLRLRRRRHLSHGAAYFISISHDGNNC
jgi:hypothetical protein